MQLMNALLVKAVAGSVDTKTALLAAMLPGGPVTPMLLAQKAVAEQERSKAQQDAGTARAEAQAMQAAAQEIWNLVGKWVSKVERPNQPEVVSLVKGLIPQELVQALQLEGADFDGLRWPGWTEWETKESTDSEAQKFYGGMNKFKVPERIAAVADKLTSLDGQWKSDGSGVPKAAEG